jgi:pyoverdine/dityrosine biosynthesis protein Dit1
MAATVADALAAGRPVEFVLPSFPFKIPNATKVEHRVPDYAELLCLQRLYEITETVRELTDAEAVFHIVSDGAIYSELCGVKSPEYRSYYETVAAFIDRIGITRELNLVDMVADIIGERSTEFEREREALVPALRSWWEGRRDEDRVRYLIRNMAGNINLAPELTAWTRASVYGGGFMSEDGSELRWRASDQFIKHVYNRAEQAAFDFTVLLTALRRTGVLARRYPGAIRATVHPKPGQWGIHLVNRESRTFPWQGVAMRTRDGSWRIVPQAEAVQRAALLVVDETTKQPLYFAERDPA